MTKKGRNLIRQGHQVVQIFEKDDPSSVLNLCGDKIAERAQELPFYLYEKTEDELEGLTANKKFTETDHLLRTAFWLEYNRAQTEGCPMKVKNVWNGICTEPYFYQKFLMDRIRLSYMLRPPKDYVVAMEEALMHGVKRVREILSMPIFDENGKAQPKNAEVILKAFQTIDMRVKGAVIQRVEQKNLNVNVSAPQKAEAPRSLEELDREILALESEALRPRVQIAREIVVTARAVDLEEKNEADD